MKQAVWLQAVAHQQDLARERQRHFVQVGEAVQGYIPVISIAPNATACKTPATTDLPTIAACIKACESGNYAESSHPGDGSGAYQFIPGTWRHYFKLWAVSAGYNGPGYDYAYQAPAWIQDAVMAYAVEHGGAHNWDPAYGNDPCTVNLP